MFAAGFETVSTAMSFCLHELALKKHIQDRVREEIQLKKSKNNGVISNDFLIDLHYLDMVLAGETIHIHYFILRFHIFLLSLLFDFCVPFFEFSELLFILANL